MKNKILYALRQSRPFRANREAWHTWHLVAEELAKAGTITRADLQHLIAE